ncbi:hypothetical protein AAC387_Pa08g0767 [Persea americana]
MFEGARWAVRGMNRVAGRPPVTKVRESIELCQGFPELLYAISISSPSVLFFTNRIHDKGKNVASSSSPPSGEKVVAGPSSPPSSRTVVHQAKALVGDLEKNIDALAEPERRQLRSRLLASCNAQVYDNIPSNFIWRDEQHALLKKLEYIFGDSANCAYDHGAEFLTY